MSYITLPQLAEIPGALELAQVASDKHQRPVSAELMELTLRAGDRSGYPAAEVQQADAAAARISQAIAEADALVDGYLGRRYTLPLPNPPGILITWSRAIVRYKLHNDRITDDRTDPIARDYRDAVKFLQLIAEGKFSLGVEDPTVGDSSAGEIQFDTGAKVFGREFMP